ncbi:Uncharacterised protein [uncultured archaeon]|nr:Uncharacterised protein [uncultured archaeon]
MRKNLLYLGIILFIIGIVAAMVSMQAAIPSGFAPVAEQLTVGANSLSSVKLHLNESGMAWIAYNSSGAIDAYIANQSAFDAIEGASSASARASVATSLEGKGVYAIYSGSTSGSFPYASSGAASPAYMNLSSAMAAGNYYLAFWNGGNSTAHITATYFLLSSAQMGSAVFDVAIYGGVSFLVAVAGIIIALVSLFIKEKTPAQAEKIDDEAQKAYEQIERGSKRALAKHRGSERKKPAAKGGK